MPKEFSRSSRIADLIQHELAEIIRRELTFPGMGLLTVSTVDVSPDLRNAKVYITALGGDLDQARLIAELNRHAGFLRHELAGRLTTRSTPKLGFVYDTSVEYGQKLSSLIDRAVAADKNHPQD